MNIYDSITVINEIFPYLCVIQIQMKRLLSIFLLIITVAAAGVVLDVYVFSEVQICSIDFSGDGGSEKDISENTEDDTEIESFRMIEIQNIFISLALQANHSYDSIIVPFMEIPVPPPENA